MKPYVISAELDLAGTGLDALIDPTQIINFREDLDQNLRDCGKQPEWVPAATLASGLAAKLAAVRQPIVSLDGRYVRGAHCLHGHVPGR